MTTQNQLNAPFPLIIGKGGTGVTSVTTSPTASAWAGWDANKNLSANSHIQGYRTTATGATTTTLVVGDAYQQYFTGATTQTVVMPVTSTLVLGQQYLITNNSAGVVTVQSSGGNTIQAMATSTSLLLTVISTSLTTASAWSQLYSSNGALPLNIVPLSLGGTNAALTAANGAIPYSTATAFALLAAGTSGQLFQSGGAGAPNWTTATYPATAGTSGNVLTSNGTNWTSAAPATNGTVTSVATAGLATGGAITTTGTVTVTAATKSDENTGTSTTTASVPANHYNNPAGIKAWAVCTNNGSSITIQDSFNVTSCTRTGTGVIDVVISVSMANTTYAVFMQHGGNANGFMRVSITAATTFTMTTSNIAGVAEDVGFWFGVVGHSTA